MNVKYLQTAQIDDLEFTVVDTETTGMVPTQSRVMDIGIVKVKGGKITETWESLIDPEQDVPYWITFYTGLTRAHVDGSPKFNELSDKILKYFAGSIFVGHNANFDYSFLTNEFTRLNIPFDFPKLCTVMLSRKLVPELGGFNLDILTQYFNIKVDRRHRALPDALGTAEALIKLIDIAKQKHNSKNFFDLDKLQRIKVDPNIDYSDSLFPIFH